MARRTPPVTVEKLLNGRKPRVEFTLAVGQDILNRIAQGEGWSEVCKLRACRR